MLSGQTATPTATLHGHISADEDGSPVASARVHLSAPSGTDLTANCDSDGNFALSNIQTGIGYTLWVEAIGFERLERTGILLKPGDNQLDTVIKIDPLQQSITVFAGTPEIKTNSEVSTSIDSQTLAALPSNTRDLPHFALLDPRARNTSGVGSDGRQATRLAINNQSFRFTQYTLDGSTNYDFIFANGPQQNVSLSALGEVKLLTNNYSAEYGRSSGGILVASTRGGSDQYHGEAFFFLRPSGIQAAPPVSTFRVPNEREDWGAAVGGPILENHTYFFGSYEGVHQERGSFIQSPTPNFFTGDLNSWMTLARIDQRWNDHEFTSLRLNSDHLVTNNLNDTVGGFVQPSAAVNDWQQSAAVQLTQRSLFGNWLNDFRLSYTDAIPLSDSAIQPGPVIVRPSYSTTGSSTYQTVRTGTYQAADTIERNWKKHNFRFGGDYVRQVAADRTNTPFGTYTFAPGPPVVGQQPLQY
ncbi:MAG TPA: carboxypeptidase-like regulatory domain-containing protein, partial [Bryobacteraceae bacterium]|nr:carboxypeptidase-like regulatory domain-containing protein [Bryobacteraceae bacterium]